MTNVDDEEDDEEDEDDDEEREEEDADEEEEEDDFMSSLLVLEYFLFLSPPPRTITTSSSPASSSTSFRIPLQSSHSFRWIELMYVQTGQAIARLGLGFYSGSLRSFEGMGVMGGPYVKLTLLIISSLYWGDLLDVLDRVVE